MSQKRGYFALAAAIIVAVAIMVGVAQAQGVFSRQIPEGALHVDPAHPAAGKTEAVPGGEIEWELGIEPITPGDTE